MKEHEWVKEFGIAVTVCDSEGTIVEMNDKAAATFKNGDLTGKNILDCHPDPARTRLAEMLKNPRVNRYTIEKDGKKKLIYQAPWTKNGKYRGLVEISLEIPFEMPHFKRK
jgi:hypothetical protein